MIRFGGLFSGVGGLELGLEKAFDALGFESEVVWQVEVNPLARRVLERHWPRATRYGDITKVTSRQLADVDAICGGFPCQDLSVAGRKAGIEEGARSGLWRDFRRIVDGKRPTFVVVENVNQTRQQWLPTVFRDLGALGYRCRAYRVAASDVGAPHERARAFALAYADRESLRKLAERVPRRRTRVLRGPWEAESARDGDAWLAPLASSFAAPPRVRGVDDGVSRRMDEARLTLLGNAVVPQVAFVVGAELVRIWQSELG